MSRRLLIVTLSGEEDVLASVTAMREKDYTIVDVYAPYPIHGLDKVLGMAQSRLTWACFIFGAIGGLGMLWFQNWTNSVAWAVNIGGKPWNSLPAHVPVSFEGMVLCAGIGTVLSFFVVARLWPGKKARQVPVNVTNDQFALVVEQVDASFDLQDVRLLLEPYHVLAMEEIVVDKENDR